MSEAEGPTFVVGIGASAGGLVAIREVLAELPPDISAAVVVAQHSVEGSQLREVLTTHCALPVKALDDGETLQTGTVYVVPGGRHGFFRDGRVRLSKPVRDSGFRPSIDGLFITMAVEYGERAIAVVLSGTMNDGMRGTQVIYDMGGRTIVQNPEEAKHGSMPMNVIRSNHPREILSATDLGKWLRDTLGAGPAQKV